MKRVLWIVVPVTLLLLAEGFYQAIFVAPTEATMGNIQRIFYYHVTSAWMAFLMFFLSFCASVAYLAYRRRQPFQALAADALALATAEMGVVFCTVVLISGPLWARPVWGIWWTWDERLTSTLMLWLIYVSYLLLRRFSVGTQARALAAVLSVFGFLDVPIVYMSTRWWRTQHPSPVIGGGPGSGLDPSMWPAVWWNLAGWFAWGCLLVALRYQLERKRQNQEQESALRALESSLQSQP